MKTLLIAPISSSALLAIMLAAAQPAMATALFRCREPGEPPLYSQFPCAAPQRVPEPAAGAQEKLILGAVQLVEIPALSDAELQRLADAEREAAAQRRSLRTARQRSQRQRARLQAQQLRDCSRAQRQLETLAARKRKGYALREARRLDADEQRLREAVKTHC